MVIVLQTSAKAQRFSNVESNCLRSNIERVAARKRVWWWFEANIASFMLKWANISLENREWNRLFVIWLGVSAQYKIPNEGS